VKSQYNRVAFWDLFRFAFLPFWSFCMLWCDPSERSTSYLRQAEDKRNRAYHVRSFLSVGLQSTRKSRIRILGKPKGGKNIESLLNPLSDVVHVRHDADVACSGCSVLYRQKNIKNGLRVFKKGENSLQNRILHFIFKLSQSPETCYKVRMHTDDKSTKSKVKVTLCQRTPRLPASLSLISF